MPARRQGRRGASAGGREEIPGAEPGHRGQFQGLAEGDQGGPEIASDLACMGVSDEEVGSGGKVLCFAMVPDTLAKETELKANELSEEVLDAVGGRGVGRPQSAQG